MANLSSNRDHHQTAEYRNNVWIKPNYNEIGQINCGSASNVSCCESKYFIDSILQTAVR